MSLYNALSVGILGINAQSTKIDSVSTNLSNISTVGYKEGNTRFSDLIASDTVADYAPGGALARVTDLNSLQGDIGAGNAPTNIAISGNGFFAVSQQAKSDGDILYTRAGSFTPDANGNLVNGAGFYLQGYQLDANGNLPGAVSGVSVPASTAVSNLQPVNVQNSVETPTATSTITLQANLAAGTPIYSGTPPYDATSSSANMASGSVAAQFSTPITVVDSTGVNHNLSLGFIKTANNTWAAELYAQPASDIAGGNAQLAAGTVTFNGDGSLASVSPSLTQFSAAWSNGAATSNISLNLGTPGPAFGTPGATSIGGSDGLTQNGGDFDNKNVQQNGVSAGSLQSVAVTDDGYVSATYSNGSTRNLYKIPLVQFANADQLTSVTGTVFTGTAAAGTPQYLQANEGGAGTMQGDALEASNVDESTQLTDLIIAQRSYQFNTKLVSTTDTMLQDLTSMGAT